MMAQEKALASMKYLWFRLDISCDDIRCYLLQIRLHLRRDKRIKTMKRGNSSFTCIQCANIYPTSKSVVSNSLGYRLDAIAKSFLHTGQCHIRILGQIYDPIGIDPNHTHTAFLQSNFTRAIPCNARHRENNVCPLVKQVASCFLSFAARTKIIRKQSRLGLNIPANNFNIDPILLIVVGNAESKAIHKVGYRLNLQPSERANLASFAF